MALLLNKRFINIKTIRWLLIIPSAIGIWHIVLICGIFIYSVLENFCPEDQVVSGVCMAHWWDMLSRFLVSLFSGISASAVVLVSTMVAPSRKNYVAGISFLIGGVAAIWLGIDVKAWYEMITALLVGGVTSIYLIIKYSHAST